MISARGPRGGGGGRWFVSVRNAFCSAAAAEAANTYAQGPEIHMSAIDPISILTSVSTIMLTKTHTHTHTHTLWKRKKKRWYAYRWVINLFQQGEGRGLNQFLAMGERGLVIHTLG